MARGWVLEDSAIDPLELSNDLLEFARAMAGEQALSLTDDRHIILLSAAGEVERYVGKMIFRGVGGASRVATSVVEVEAPFNVPAVGAMPRSAGVTVDAVELWDDEAEAFAPSTYIRRPLGLIRVPRAGTYRIVASVLPAANFPTQRSPTRSRSCSAYREEYRPRHSASELSDGAAPSVAGAIPSESGAAEALRFYRVPGAVDGREARARGLSQHAPGCRLRAGVQGGCGWSVCGLRRVRVRVRITKSRSTGAGLNCPAWAASCGCAGRVIFGDTHRGGASRGTHCLTSCGEADGERADLAARFADHVANCIVALTNASAISSCPSCISSIKFRSSLLIVSFSSRYRFPGPQLKDGSLDVRRARVRRSMSAASPGGVSGEGDTSACRSYEELLSLVCMHASIGVRSFASSCANGSRASSSPSRNSRANDWTSVGSYCPQTPTLPRPPRQSHLPWACRRSSDFAFALTASNRATHCCRLILRPAAGAAPPWSPATPRPSPSRTAPSPGSSEGTDKGRPRRVRFSGADPREPHGGGEVNGTAHYRTHAATPGVFPKHFTPFARAGLSLTGIAVGVRSVGTWRK